MFTKSVKKDAINTGVTATDEIYLRHIDTPGQTYPCSTYPNDLGDCPNQR